MNGRAAAFIVVFSLLVLVAAASFVQADIGLKPTVTIIVKYENNPISGTSYAKMLWCSKPGQSNPMERGEIPQLNLSIYDSAENCTWIPSGLAWGGKCEDSICSFDYFPPNPFRLAVFLPDFNKTFITYSISRNNFNSYYNAEFFADGSAKITETTGIIAITGFGVLAALAITLLLELVVVALFFSKKKSLKKILITVAVANIITVPVVQLVAPLYGTASLAAAEIFAFVFEAVFIYALNKKEVTVKSAFVFSLIANVVSFIVGTLIFILPGL